MTGSGEGINDNFQIGGRSGWGGANRPRWPVSTQAVTDPSRLNHRGPASRGRPIAMPEMTPLDERAITAIARRHGLALVGEIELNEIGLDFRAAFATDE